MLSTHAAASVQSAIDAFIEHFGDAPASGAMAPGRVNLIGEHTDYNDGLVMPLAIDRHTIVLARPVAHSSTTVWAKDLDESLVVDFSARLSRRGDGFGDYILAVIDQFQRRGAGVQAMHMMITGDIPRGAGLSSSASLEVAVATLLEQMCNHRMPPREKALLCRAAEQQFVGVPCGIMDMFIISMARRDTAMLIDCRLLDHQFVPLPSSDDATLLIVDTGVERSLRSGAYASRRQTCASAARKLGVASLRDATGAAVHQSGDLTTMERECALHVISENARVVEAAAALQSLDLHRLGQLMFASHDSLRDGYRVSIPELDVIVDAARSMVANGVFGARMTGAGFGGCAIVLCTPNGAARVIERVQAEFQRRFHRTTGVFAAAAMDGARVINVVSNTGPNQ